MGRFTMEYNLGRSGRIALWALVVVGLVTIVAAIVLLVAVPPALASTPLDYGMMIDGGSSGSRIYLYSWPRRVSEMAPVLSPVFDPATNTPLVMKILPGLQAYLGNTSAAGASLSSLIDFAKQHIPSDSWSSSPIFLEATAGLRKLDPSVSAAIIASVQAYLSTTPFLFKNEWARIIPGQEEAINGWLSVNFLQGSFHNATGSTWGSVEVGGASMQVAFVPSDAPPPDQSWNVTLSGTLYSVYIQSYLYFGLTEARYILNNTVYSAENGTMNATISHPCFNSGYTETVQTIINGAPVQYNLLGTGDYSACMKYSLLLLNQSAPCPSPPCAFNGIHQPPLGMDNFMKALAFYQLPGNYSISDLDAASDSFCSTPWAEATLLNPNVTVSVLKDYCFMGAYLRQILAAGLGIPATDHTRMSYALYLNGFEMSWTVGAMFLQVNSLPWHAPSWFSSRVHLLALVLPILLFGVLCFALYFLWRGGTPQERGYEEVASS